MTKPTSISDINKKYKYTDEFPGGKHDDMYVSCAQHGDYNELKTAFGTKLENKVNSGTITDQEAVDILDSACTSLKNPRLRKDFYEHIDKELKKLID